MLIFCNCASVNNWTVAWLSLLLAVAFEKYLIVLLIFWRKCCWNIYGYKKITVHMWLIEAGKATAKLNSYPNLLPWCPSWAMKPLRSQGVVVQGPGWGWLGSYLLLMYLYKFQMPNGLLKWYKDGLTSQALVSLHSCNAGYCQRSDSRNALGNLGLHKIILYIWASRKRSRVQPKCVLCLQLSSRWFFTAQHTAWLFAAIQLLPLPYYSGSKSPSTTRCLSPPLFLHCVFYYRVWEPGKVLS